jgi:hypothetical protein
MQAGGVENEFGIAENEIGAAVVQLRGDLGIAQCAAVGRRRHRHRRALEDEERSVEKHGRRIDVDDVLVAGLSRANGLRAVAVE